MLQFKKIFIKVLSIYFSIYLLLVPLIIISQLNDFHDIELEINSALSYIALAADDSINLSFNQNQYLKQIKTLIELRVKIDRSDILYSDKIYQVLKRLYSGNHHLNLDSARPFPGPEISSTISRSPPLFS